MSALIRGALPAPDPNPGLSRQNFTRIGYGGLGDGHNSFAHSMAWFKGRIFVGATRSNLCMLRHQTSYTQTPLKIWPIECPETRDEFYATVDRRSQIWAFDPKDQSWERVYIAPEVLASDGNMVGRDIGYRSMEVFHGPETEEPALYVSTWAPGRAPGGGLILRSVDGKTFEPVTPPGIIDDSFATTRSLTTFKGKMHFAPTAQRDRKGIGKGDQQNYAKPVIFAATSPEQGDWEIINPPAFGDDANKGIFTLATANGQLYAGTLNLEGLQIWATDGTLKDGGPEYVWRKICTHGAGRGPLNQAVASMCEFKGALYVGTGIQGGGNDRVNKVGPAAAEILRVNPDDSVDVIVGDRDEDGDREPLSGLTAGFGHFFNGYMWTMAEHDGWLYVGTYDWATTLRWAKFDTAPRRVQQLMELVGTENLIDAEGGSDLWRTADGENWLPVDRRGFGNVYNWGLPQSGLHAQRSVRRHRQCLRPESGRTHRAGHDEKDWDYVDNPFGGMEVWQARSTPSAPPWNRPERTRTSCYEPWRADVQTGQSRASVLYKAARSGRNSRPNRLARLQTTGNARGLSPAMEPTDQRMNRIDRQPRGRRDIGRNRVPCWCIPARWPQGRMRRHAGLGPPPRCRRGRPRRPAPTRCPGSRG